MFSSISRSSKLYPAVALYVDLILLPGIKRGDVKERGFERENRLHKPHFQKSKYKQRSR